MARDMMFWLKDNNESVAVHVREQVRLVFTGVSDLIFRALLTGRSRQEVVRSICESYEVAPEIALADVDYFVAELVAAQMITSGGGKT